MNLGYGIQLLPLAGSETGLIQQFPCFHRVYGLSFISRFFSFWPGAVFRSRMRQGGRNLDLGDALIATTVKA